MALSDSDKETLDRIKEWGQPSYMPPEWPKDESVAYLGEDWHTVDRVNPEHGYVLVPDGYEGEIYE